MTGRRAGRWAGVQAGGWAERQEGRHVKYKMVFKDNVWTHKYCFYLAKIFWQMESFCRYHRCKYACIWYKCLILERNITNEKSISGAKWGAHSIEENIRIVSSSSKQFNVSL